MLLIREIMYCKPGKVRPLVEKFKAMAQLMEKQGGPKMRILTDLSAERYWTLVSEIEVENLQQYLDMDNDSENAEEYGRIMQGYHDLVHSGRREIYNVED